MWAYESVFYQIYPLGFCNAPLANDGQHVSRILDVINWIPHIKKTGSNAIYFSPVFESDRHGYDTRDFQIIDCRLGSNEDFAKVCNEIHKQGLKVVLDGVFNHVGRGFWAFQDVLLNRDHSSYKDWFNINFDGDNAYNDNLWYDGWEGHYELVKLNLSNPQVMEYLFHSIQLWVDQFDIDGIRLDVAYCLSIDFITKLRSFTNSLKDEFFLVGELLHGDYNQFMSPTLLHSSTNYECYKGLYSSFNCMNMFEINHSLLRQFGPDNWSLYKDKHLLCFVDNHDVSRIASLLEDKNHIPLIYGLLFAMPGIPCIYYGSEWGTSGLKQQGSDENLRPSFELPDWNVLTEQISLFASAHKQNMVFSYGDYSTLLITNKQLVFQRSFQNDKIIVAINIDSNPFTAYFNESFPHFRNLLGGDDLLFSGSMDLPPYSVAYYNVTQ